MQVSTIAELDTHAVIGGGEAKSFGMDDSAELYALLSDKIYRDKKRAAMRETICNAWDAHISVGKTDLPVEITVTDTEIKIRDFGPGIPDALMHSIYCIYGKSTKVKDDKATGGFGLGSKSPFAVTDHFNVVSMYEGIKSVYAISRGGVATDGKPDMRLMMSVPTTESGLLVSIPVKSRSDRYEFEGHIRAVVKQGGMLVNMNGTPLDRFNWTEARKTEYAIIPQGDLTEGRVYVLYGTVMYPLTTTDAKIRNLAQKAVDLCGTMSILVLLPPPNSIGVTPSREALSFSPVTDETLIRLLNKVIAQIRAALPAASRRVLRSWVERQGRKALDTHYNSTRMSPGLLPTADLIAEHAMRTDSYAHSKGGVERRAVAKIAQKLWRDDRRYYRRAVKTYGTGAELEFQRTAMPALRIASKMGLLKDLMVFDIYRHKFGIPGPKTLPITEIPRTGYVFPVLCVARNMRDLRPQLSNSSTSFRYNISGEHFYTAGLVMRQWTDKNLKALRELCDHYNIELHLFDYEDAKKNRKPPVKREGAETYFVLEDFGAERRNKIKTPIVPTCIAPDFYLMTWQRDAKLRLPFAAAHLLQQITELYPNTALITTKAQEEKLQKAGARSLGKVVAERVAKLGNSREVLYGEAIRHGRMIDEGDGYYHNSIPEALVKLSKMDMRFAKLLFPDKATPGKAHAEASLLWDFLLGLEYQPEDTREVVKTAMAGVRQAIKETFPPITKNRVEQLYSYLGPIRGASIISDLHYSPRSDLALDMIETIKFLQRRHEAKKNKIKAAKVAITPAANANIALKEAA